ncbi:MAG: hypothetical protein ACYC9H_12980 [Sulfuricaulis sp.]
MNDRGCAPVRCTKIVTPTADLNRSGASRHDYCRATMPDWAQRRDGYAA